MEIIRDPQIMQKICSDLKSENQSIGFVPTMGALHQGHMRLVDESLENNQATIVSIFVNPAQFNNNDDFDNYPETLSDDIDKLSQAKVNFLFLPTNESMYEDGYRFKVTENKESMELCGQSRPGHFDGVLSVVLRLFNIIQPQRVYFGEKDYQQLSLIKDMVKAFFLKIDVIPVATVREDNGLALSSRNTRLTANGKEKAMRFASILKTARNKDEAATRLNENQIDIDYIIEKSGRRFGAVFIDDVRLIDNVPI